MIAPLNELKTADILRLRKTKYLHVFELAGACKCYAVDVAFLLWENKMALSIDETEYLIKFFFALGLSDNYIISTLHFDRVTVLRILVMDKLSEPWMKTNKKFYDKVLYYLWVKFKFSVTEIANCLNISSYKVSKLLYARDPSITFDVAYNPTNKKPCIDVNNPVRVASTSQSVSNEFYTKLLPLINDIGEDIFDYIDKKYTVFGVDTADKLKLLSARYLALQAGASVAEIAVLSHSTRQTINVFANRFIAKQNTGVNVSVYSNLQAEYRRLHLQKCASNSYIEKMNIAENNKKRALALAKQGYSPQDIAAKLSISCASVYSYSKAWPAELRTRVVDRSRPSTRECRAKIRKLAADGVSEAEIARQLNVNLTTVKCALAYADGSTLT